MNDIPQLKQNLIASLQYTQRIRRYLVICTFIMALQIVLGMVSHHFTNLFTQGSIVSSWIFDTTRYLSDTCVVAFFVIFIIIIREHHKASHALIGLMNDKDLADYL